MPPTTESVLKETDALPSLIRKSLEELFHDLRSSSDGLSAREAASRLQQFGPNEIAREKLLAWHTLLFKCVQNPLVYLLAFLALVSYATDDKPGSLLIASMVVLSVGLTFFQEYRSNRAAEKLKAMVHTTATVLRPPTLSPSSRGASLGSAGARDEVPNRLRPPLRKEPEIRDGSPIPGGSVTMEVPLRTIVPGDVVRLSAGDMVPADLRLISSKDLHVSQSALTGESMPVEKDADGGSDESAGDLEQPCLCFMGSNVVSGSAMALVLATGPQTYFGSLANKITVARVMTSFDKGVNQFTWLMLSFMLVMAPVVFLVNGLTKHNWLEAFLFGLSVAVGLTPEMLPMIVTVNLSKGAMSMSKKSVIVKRLNSIQNFGAMDVLCTDKTGTLTLDQVVLEKYCNLSMEEDPSVLQFAYWISYYQTGLRNLMDRAVLAREKVDLAGTRKVDEMPFDFSRKIMSVVVEKQGAHWILTKGAPEEIFKRCKSFEVDDEVDDMENLELEDLRMEYEQLSSDGFRVLAVAYKRMEEKKKAYGRADESGLVLKGYLAFLDPAKPSARRAITALRHNSVSVKILTGDNDIITRKICRDVGLKVDQLVLGSQVETMDDPQLAESCQSANVFARLTPDHKERIIKALQSKGRVVGFLGDGINDAAALKAADVGISVDSAVDIAKESADIILLRKSLMVLNEGVVEGRKVFGNIVKYIKMGASSNFGNMFSVVGASALLPFLPMKPIQILTNNLLYDFSQTTIPFDQVDPEYLMVPRKWEMTEIREFMVWIGPISSIFDYTTYALMWFFFGCTTPEKQDLFQTGWFVESLLTQTLIIHVIRTWKIPFIESRAATPLLLSTFLISATGIILPLSPLRSVFGFVTLPWAFYPFLLLTLLAYLALTQLVKNYLFRKLSRRSAIS